MDNDLVGQWIIKSGRMIADEIENEIESRINGLLEKISTSDDGWTSLYVDRKTNSYWELTYVDSSTHGGGPRRLRRIEKPKFTDKS